MLVVPDFWRRQPLGSHPSFCRWLRELADEGVEMILHGYCHRDEVASHATWWDGVRSRHFTAGEAEFLGLDEDEARERMRRGRELLEALLDTPIRGFVAPAWLYGRGARRALRRERFLFAEDHWSVWSPRQARILVRGPVLAYASRARARVASSLAWSRISTAMLAGATCFRLAIHPHDLDVPRLQVEIDRVLTRLLGQRTAIRYDELPGTFDSGMGIPARESADVHGGGVRDGTVRGSDSHGGDATADAGRDPGPR